MVSFTFGMFPLLYSYAYFISAKKKKKKEKKGYPLGQLCTIMQIYVPKIYPLVGNIVHNMGIALVITSLGIYT